ncbi:MAG TPA: flagellar hook protein FlgE [Methylocella sp.]|nr:flagellar hook protein FlgE [Methylocella sp.]
MSVMNTSASGMLADTQWLSTISQNIANSNTTGYKNVETDFTALVDEIASPNDPGMGVTTSMQTLNALQGSVVSTSTSTDLAVQGTGFFVVSDSSGDIYLTRNGSFTPNASGDLVNSAGYYLMGYSVASGATAPTNESLSSLQKVNVNAAGESATPTSSGSLVANLPSTAVPVAAAKLPSVNSASSVYTDQTSVVTYDNLGQAHTLDIYFTNTGSNTWEVDVFDHADAAAGGSFPYSAGPLATENLTFSATNGTLTSGSPITVAIPNGQKMSLDLSNMTQVASAFNVSQASANGNPPASLTGVTFSANGALSYQYSDGTSQIGYQVPLGNVPSPNNLTSLDGGCLSPNSESGAISLGNPGNDGLGSLVPSALESSTVDLATELTEMIQAQSAYEANSKAFQTGANLYDVLNQLHP